MNNFSAEHEEEEEAERRCVSKVKFLFVIICFRNKDGNPKQKNCETNIIIWFNILPFGISGIK